METKHMESKFMVIRLLCVIIFFCNILNASSQSSQINIGIGDECMDKNTIILSEFLLDVMGDEFVSDFLEKEKSLLFAFKVDSLGRIVDVVRIIERKSIDSGSKDKILSSLKSSNLRFTICFGYDPYLSGNRAYEILTKDLFTEEKPTFIITVDFPGRTLFHYELKIDLEKERMGYVRNDNETKQTKLQNLKNLIKESSEE